jgi:hypothetical protein
MKSKTAIGALLVLIPLCLACPRDDEPVASDTGTQVPASAAQNPATAPPAKRPLPPLTREDIYIFIEGLLKPELPADVRVWTAEQLARATVEEEAVNDALRAILDDPEPEVAAAAAAALAKRGALPAESAPPSASPEASGAAPPGMRVETLD